MEKVTLVVFGNKLDHRTHKMIDEDVNFLANKNYDLADIAIQISEKYGFNIKAEENKIYIT